MKILDGKELAGFVKERQRHQVAGLSKKPHLLIIRNSDSPVIAKYVNLKMEYLTPRILKKSRTKFSKRMMIQKLTA